jgi:PhoH-like ATPase
MGNKKIYVIDTNVLLYDSSSIYSFEDNYVVIPIVVLEELDKFKKGNDLINYHARETMRELLAIIGENSIGEDWISFGDSGGVLNISMHQELKDKSKVHAAFPEEKADHMILSAVEYFSSRCEEKVVLVTKDINLIVKAKSVGLNAEDYKTSQIKNTSVLSDTVTIIEPFDHELISKLYTDGTIKFETYNHINSICILKSGSSSALVRNVGGSLVKVDKVKAFGIEPRNAEQTFAMDMLVNPGIGVSAITGKAGTGKTLLALAAALYLHQSFDKIYIARPIVALSNRDIGYLPGDVDEKIAPYMQPLYDNIAVIKNGLKLKGKDITVLDDMLKNGKIEVLPLTYIRGRSLSNAFIIVDEAQNTSPLEIKTIITRAGEGTRMAFTGDVMQIDSPYLDSTSNGLSYIIDRMRGSDMFAHMNLVKSERSRLAEFAADVL